MCTMEREAEGSEGFLERIVANQGRCPSPPLLLLEGSSPSAWYIKITWYIEVSTTQVVRFHLNEPPCAGIL